MQGLVFNRTLLAPYLESNSPAERHNSMNIGYVVLNWVGRLRNRLKRNPTFRGSWRKLDADGARDIRIASSAAKHFDDEESSYQPKNIGWFKTQSEKYRPWQEATVEVIALPEPHGQLRARLASEHIDLTVANPPRMAPDVDSVGGR